MSQHLYRDHDFEFGQALLNLRSKIKLTQSGLADQLGVSRRTVSDWETGTKFPKAENLKQFIQIAIRHAAFKLGQETVEIRTLWQLAHVRVMLDESWLTSVIDSASARKAGKEPAADFRILPYSTALQANRAVGVRPIEIKTNSYQEWGEAPKARNFSGRQRELAEVTRWLTQEDCRVAAIIGMGGIGKTSFSIHLGQQLNEQFDLILWRSMRSAPPFNEFLAAALQFFSHHSLITLSASADENIATLIGLFRQNRCLLFLDNLETLLDEGLAGTFREDFANYASLIQRVAESEHQSCLVLTSREKPRNLVGLEDVGAFSPVRTLRLGGLDAPELQEILAGQGLYGDRAAWRMLIERFGGNPLALKMVSETVRETFGHNIQSFLAADTVVFGDVGNLLNTQFKRLTRLEQDLMFWLAIEREPVGLGTLESNIIKTQNQPGNRRNLLEALESLRRRSLLENSEAGNAFTLQPVIMEYVSELLIEQVYEEILAADNTSDGELYEAYLVRYALMKALTRDYIRQSQQRLIVGSLLERLRGIHSDTRLAEGYLHQALGRVRTLPRAHQGYAGGNLINLLIALGSDLRGHDLSGLNLREAHLSGVELHGVNLAGCDLSRTTFTEGFDYILALAYHPAREQFASGEMNGSIKIWQSEQRLEGNNYAYSLDFHGHSASVSSLAYSPDGQYLASGSYDRTVRIWSAGTGENLLTGKSHSEAIRTVVFSPDSRLLASVSLDGTICLWQVATGRLLVTLATQTGWVWTLAFSPDGQTLATGSFNDTISLWRLDDILNSRPGPAATFTARHGGVFGLVFNQDGQLLYSCGADGKIRVWTVADQQPLHIAEGHRGAATVLAFNADYTKLVSSGSDHTISLWNVDSSQGGIEISKRLVGHNAPVVALTFNPTGTILISSSSDYSLRFWSLERGEPLICLQGHVETSATLAVNPDGNSIAANVGNRALIWPLGKLVGGPPYSYEQPVTPIIELKGHQQPILVSKFNLAGNMLATAGQDAFIKLWDINLPNQRGQAQSKLILKGYFTSIHSLAFSPDGQQLAGGDNEGIVRVWSTISGQLLTSLKRHEGVVWTLVYSPDGTNLISGGNDGQLRMWDANLLGPKAVPTIKGSPIADLAVHPDGHFLACAGFDGSLIIWMLKDGGICGEPLRLTGHTGAVNSLAFQPGSEVRILSGGEDGTLRLWDVANKCEVTRFQHGRYVQSVAFIQDGKAALSAGEGGIIKMWQIPEGRQVGTFRDFQLYEGVNITGATGLTPTCRATLVELGAVEIVQP